MTSNSIKTIIVGLSGPSSSGKTTLARLLREIFNITEHHIRITLFIVHEDDFYKTDTDIPWRTWTSTKHGERKLQDWDCVESLDLALIKRITSYVKAHGKLPTDFASKEDQNSVGETHITNVEIEAHRDDIQKWLLQHTQSQSTPVDSATEIRICILEGFLLFPPPEYLRSSSTAAPVSSGGTKPPEFFPTSPEQLSELGDILASNLDLKIFLPSTKKLTIDRRAARSGYVTLEGFWEDPPGYVEELVWPNYTRDQGWLFDDMESINEGKVNVEKAGKEGILIGPGRGNQGMKMVLDWGVDVLKTQIRALLK